MAHSSSRCVAIVLAAGRSTRLHSDTNKLLHAVAGQSCLAHVLDALSDAGIEDVIIVTSDELRAHPAFQALLANKKQMRLSVTTQGTCRGTGAAVRDGIRQRSQLEGLATHHINFIAIPGDAPLLTGRALKQVADGLQEASCVVLSMTPPNAHGYGRCIIGTSSKGGTIPLLRIVEDKHATPDEKRVSLCNSGIIGWRNNITELLESLAPHPHTQETYITDLVDLCHQHGHTCISIESDYTELLGVNTRADLANAEAHMQKRLRANALASGVTLKDPDSTFLSFDTRFEKDVTLFPSVHIGPGCTIQRGAQILPFSVLSATHVGPHCTVGPMAHLLEGTVLHARSRVGNFTEVKRSTLGHCVTAKHLSYIGDANVGDRTNIGAGTITCNYDGTEKHQTTIKQDVFVGANSSLVAPITLEKGSQCGAGSVVTKDIPENTLFVGRPTATFVQRKKKTR